MSDITKVSVNSAKAALFRANATHHKGFDRSVGFSAYSVGIEHYSYDQGHYMPFAEMYKIQPVIEAFNNPEFLKPGSFLGKYANSNNATLKNFFDSFSWEREKHGYAYFQSSNSAVSDYKGIWPAVEILASAAHHVQLDKGLTLKEKEFWRQHIGCVENKLGVADTMKFTERARKYGNQLTPKIIIPDVVFPYEPPKLTHQVISPEDQVS